MAEPRPKRILFEPASTLEGPSPGRLRGHRTAFPPSAAPGQINHDLTGFDIVSLCFCLALINARTALSGPPSRRALTFGAAHARASAWR